tara:strand:- start:482 stop:865 length:384 start_codon:yes stop_codon:yes gene_type:complete
MTESEAQQYLQQLGITVPSVILTRLISKSQGADACLDENGVSADDKALIQFYLLGLYAISSGGRRVKSQSAPSGASQSYEYGSLVDQMRQLKASLAVLDKYGCTAGLIPAEPGDTAALFVVTGRKCP